jgi:hypothetical protein
MHRRFAIADNAISHGAARPSYVVLPLVPR